MTTSNQDEQADDTLLSQLRKAIFDADPPPEDLVERAHRAFTWDAALEVLTESELVLDGAPDLRSNELSLRVVEFEGAGCRIRIEFEQLNDESTQLVGSVTPVPLEVKMIEPGGTGQSLDIDSRRPISYDHLGSGSCIADANGRWL